LSPCKAAGDIWSCKLRNSKGVGEIVWTASGSVDYETPSKYRSATDLHGKSRTLPGSINLTTSPILLQKQVLDQNNSREERSLQ